MPLSTIRGFTSGALYFYSNDLVSCKISFSKVKTRSREELSTNNFDFNGTTVSVGKSVGLDMQLERKGSYFVEEASSNVCYVRLGYVRFD